MNENKGHLLYLDTRDLPPERDAQILAAVESGHRLCIATDRPEKYRYHQVDHLIDTPVGSYDVAERQIGEFVAAHGITLAGVLCWKDREVELASRIAARYGLHGHSAETARRVRDKAETRRALGPLGAQPKHAVVRSRTEFVEALRMLPVPALLKPAGNSGSRGIVRVTDRDSDAAWNDFSEYNARATGDMFAYYAGHALLEEEIRGSEHSVAGLVHDGRVIITALADKRFEREIFMQYENVVPSQLPEDVQSAIVTVVTAAVKAVGMTDAGFHADVMVDSSGKPYILEIGGRLGGEMINSHLIPLAYGGFSPYRELIRILTGESSDAASDLYRRPRMQAGARIVRAPRVGTIERLEGVDALQKHPAVRAVLQMKGPGAPVRKPRDKFKEYELVYVIAQCGPDENMHALLESLEALIRVEMYSETPAAV